MDFIERLFGQAPDGGDGSLEAVWLAAIAVSISLVVIRRRLMTWLSSYHAQRPDTSGHS